MHARLPPPAAMKRISTAGETLGVAEAPEVFFDALAGEGVVQTNPVDLSSRRYCNGALMMGAP